MNDETTHLNRAEHALKLAKSMGADAADVMIYDSRDTSVRVRLGAVESVEQAESQGIGIRVLVGAKGGYRQAMVSSTNLEDAALISLIEQAVAMAKLSPIDPYTDLADSSRLAKHWPDLQLADTITPTVTQLQSLALETEQAALDVKGVTNSDAAEASTGTAGFALVTSHGFAGFYRSSHHGVGVSVIAGEGTTMETDYDDTGARFWADLRPVTEVGRNAGERAVKRLNPRKMGTKKIPVVYDSRAARGLLGNFLSAINGAAIARKTSFLLDFLHQPVFAPGITIIDNPLLVRGLASEPFDAEGIATAPLTLVADGVLQTWLLDTRTANQLGMVSTGHASRGLSSAPSPSCSNVHLAAGQPSVTELIADITEGFYITEAFGQGVNGVTGDYSKGASGFWIEKGKITFPVSEMTIAGNLKDMFAELTPANDLEMRHGINSPSVRLNGLTVAGV